MTSLDEAFTVSDHINDPRFNNIDLTQFDRVAVTRDYTLRPTDQFTNIDPTDIICANVAYDLQTCTEEFDVSRLCSTFKINKSVLETLTKKHDNIKKEREDLGNQFQIILKNIMEFRVNVDRLSPEANTSVVTDVIPILKDLEKQAGMQLDLKLSNLHDKLSRVEKAHDTTRELFRCALAESKIEKTHENITCPVCFEKPVDRVFVPCGHTICQGCLKNASNPQKCCVCRGTGTTSTLYFSV